MFHFVMIKPSHYDDDGYPIQWFRSAIPSNTLACLNGLAEDARRRSVLGPDVEIRLHTYDETNRRVHPARIIRMLREVGRARPDRARRRAVEPVPARGRPGAAVPRRRAPGVHRRLSRLRLPRHAAGDAAGNARGAGARHLVLRRRGRGRAARRGAARRLARHAEAALQLHGRSARPCRASRRRSCRSKHVMRTVGSLSSFDLGRGCPYQCSFCTIINVQGRKSRFRIARRPRAHHPREPRAGHPRASSSPTTISPATGTGKRCSTG